MRTGTFCLFSLCTLLISGCAIKPEPIQETDVQQRVETDQKLFFSGMETPNAPITLHEAMARALKYNLEQRIKSFEEELSQGLFQQSLFSLLPQLNASASRAHRSNYSASWSEDFRTGAQSLQMSKSQEKNRNLADGTFYWNLLDFGVSYAQAQQQADQTLIAKEQRRRARQDIIRDVQQAYWQAITADALLGRVEKLLVTAEGALRKSEEMERKKLQPMDKSLEYQQALLERIGQLVGLRKNLDMARVQLATLINLPPGSSFKLDLSARDHMQVADKMPDPFALTTIALQQRPELREEDYQKRISELEIRKAMLRMLPGIELSLNRQYDSNKYLNSHAWSDAALKVSYNILNLFSAPVAIENAETQKEIAEARRLALGMAVVSQVHLATRRYQHSVKEFTIADQLYQVQGRRSKLAKSAKEAEAGDVLESIKMEVGELLSEVQRDLSYAELQSSMGVILHTIGQDPLSEELEDQGIEAMAKSLKNNWQLKGVAIPAPDVAPPPPIQDKAAPPAKPEDHAALSPPSDYVVHVASFTDLREVGAFQNRINRLGIKSYVLTSRSEEKSPDYVVRLESMDRQRAEEAVAQIRKLGMPQHAAILPATRYWL